MKIHYFSLYLTESTGLKESYREFDCKETDSCYIVQKESTFGGKTTRVKKSEILQVDSMAREGICDILQFYTWFLDGYLLDAKQLVKDKMVDVATKQYDKATKLLSYLK